jgi:cytosine deaminase
MGLAETSPADRIDQRAYNNMIQHNPKMVDLCFELAVEGGREGVPIGSVLVRGEDVVGRGFNKRVQEGDPIAHGEMDCLRNAGRQKSYRDTTLYTSLSPCMMCSGTIVQFKIPRVVILENVNFGGNEDFLRSHGVDIEVLQEARCIDLMSKFIRANPELWNEDIAD